MIRLGSTGDGMTKPLNKDLQQRNHMATSVLARGIRADLGIRSLVNEQLCIHD